MCINVARKNKVIEFRCFIKKNQLFLPISMQIEYSGKLLCKRTVHFVFPYIGLLIFDHA